MHQVKSAMNYKFKCFILQLVSIFCILPTVFADDLPQIIKKIELPVNGYQMEVYDITYNDYLNGVSQMMIFNYDEGIIKDVIVKDKKNGALISKNEYHYTDDNVQKEMISYLWENGNWETNTKNEYDFDANGNQVSFASYKYENGAWIGLQKEEKKINNLGLLSELKMYSWQNNDWVLESSQLITFNDSKKPTQVVSQVLNNGSLTNSSETTYIYTGESLTQELYKSWNGSSFENAFRITYSYTASNNVEIKLIEYFSENKWANLEKYAYVYSNEKPKSVVRSFWNDKGKEIKSTMSFSYNNDVVELNESSSLMSDKWKYDYSDGFAVYKYDNDAWKGISKSSYTNNHEDLFKNSLTFYNWSDDKWSDKPVNRVRWDYDAAKMEKLTFYQERLNTTANAYSLTKEMIFNVSEPSVINEISNPSLFSIFPNPVTDVLNVRLNNLLSKDAPYFIYNTTGRLIATGLLTGSEQTIDVGFLPSGQYIFTLKNGTEQSSLILLKL